MAEQEQPNSESSTGAAFLSFAKDPRFYVPLAILILFETLLQLGAYAPLLKPESYAESVRHMQRTVATSPVRPNLLLLGTSVAYQGVLLPRLNTRIKPAGFTAQSGAAQGAKLITQHMIYRSLKGKVGRLRIVGLVSETSFPWAARRGLDQPNLSMIAQMSRLNAHSLFRAYDHELRFADYLFLHLRSYAYRRDLRALLLSPLKRLKRISRYARKRRLDYPYVNHEHRAISVFRARNLHECVANAVNPRIPTPGPDGRQATNRHHRGAVKQTCEVGLMDPGLRPGGEEWNRLFFRRLRLLHQEIQRDGAIPVTIFAPYSTLIRDMNSDARLALWHRELTKMHGRDGYHIIDLRKVLDGPRNGDLFYDTIHLNRAGAERFTDALALELNKLAARLEARRRSTAPRGGRAKGH